jgi:16S rRNA (cytidine1402-2'-O)-methyltransferase
MTAGRARRQGSGAGGGHGPDRPGSAAAGGSAGPAGPTTGAPSGGGRLFVVATPIGNLGDVSYRAIETLRDVPLIAAEDTRLTRRLLARYEIATRLISYHARSGPGRELELLAHLRSGADLALVTDAGTPLVSDPGAELAAAWAGEGGAVVPIPGASAVLAALVASGLPAAHWTFEGFLPRSGRERRERLTRIATDERACVIYEAPSRVPATLTDLAAAAGPQRRVAVCRELTKIHEEVVRGGLGELAARGAAGELTLRGEFAIVVAAVAAGSAASAGSSTDRPAPSAGEARAEVDRLVMGGLKRSEAVRRVAAAMGLDRRSLYREAAAGDDQDTP